MKENNIYYEVIGHGTPLLIIHGFGVDHQLMKGALEPILENRFKRIYIDLPGMGKSPVNGQIHNADDMLVELINFIDTHLHNESFLLMGQSYGGYLSLGLLKKLKSRVLGLCLLCPCVIASFNERILPQHVITHKEIFKITDNGEWFNDFMELAVHVTKDSWLHYQKEILPGIKLANQNFLKTYQQNGYEFNNLNLFDYISFDKPSLVMMGKQDQIVGYEDTMKCLHQFKHLTTLVVDGAGHNLQLDQPNIFKTHVMKWLDDIDIKVL